DDRTERGGLGLDLVRLAALLRRGGDRFGMGDRRLDRLGVVARPRARQGRRAIAMRRWTRWHSGFRRLAADRFERAERLALDVSGRRVACSGRAVDPPQHPGIAALGAR